MNNLPTEILVNIFKYLLSEDPYIFSKLHFINKRFNKIIKKYFKNDFIFIKHIYKLLIINPIIDIKGANYLINIPLLFNMNYEELYLLDKTFEENNTILILYDIIENDEDLFETKNLISDADDSEFTFNDYLEYVFEQLYEYVIEVYELNINHLNGDVFINHDSPERLNPILDIPINYIKRILKKKYLQKLRSNLIKYLNTAEPPSELNIE